MTLIAPFVVHEGVAAPMLIDNVDTDVIIPIGPLMTTPRSRLGEVALKPLRYRDDGSENPDFVLNRPQYRGASILVAGRNFGCGSSREPAVYALFELGIRVILAPSFGDIFQINCTKNGILPVILPSVEYKRVAQLVEDVAGSAPVRVDLTTQFILLPDGGSIAFEIDAGQRARLMDGRDEVDRTLERDGEIDAFQLADRVRRQWAWDAVLRWVPSTS